MKCSRESEILHKLAHDATRMSSCFFDFRVVSRIPGYISFTVISDSVQTYANCKCNSRKLTFFICTHCTMYITVPADLLQYCCFNRFQFGWYLIFTKRTFNWKYCTMYTVQVLYTLGTFLKKQLIKVIKIIFMLSIFP